MDGMMRQGAAVGQGRWMRRLGVWLCLIALLLGQGLTQYHASMMGGMGYSQAMPCHDGKASDAPAPGKSPFSGCDRCPLCQAMGSAALDPSAAVAVVGPVQYTALRVQPITAFQPDHATVPPGHSQPRAPPVIG